MKTKFRHCFVMPAILLMTWNAAAMAQSGYGSHHGHHHQHRYRGGDYVPYGFGFGYGPSTAAESYLRGRADLVRAYGQANYHNSMAQVYWEQARAKSIENREARVQQFFALRALNEQQRFAQFAKSRLSKEQLVAVSKKTSPQRLDEQNWNVATDGLAWPSALQGEIFQEERSRLDELFRLRRDRANSDRDILQLEVDRLAKQMTEGLKRRISALKPADYVVAKRFLASVAHEVRFDLKAGEQLAGR
jgi:hypothetical protein